MASFMTNRAVRRILDRTLDITTGCKVMLCTAGLTAGTRTLDAEPILELPTNQTITTPNPTYYEKELEVDMAHGNHPMVFAQNEGFIVRGPTIVFGAAGTANLAVDVAWAELTAF